MSGYAVGLMLRLLCAAGAGWDVSRGLWRGVVGLAGVWLIVELAVAYERRRGALAASRRRRREPATLRPRPSAAADDWFLD